MSAPTGTSVATDDVFIDGRIITAENVASLAPRVFARDGTARMHVLRWALALAVVADGTGAANFAIGPVTTAAPSGLPIVSQAITADPGGPFGLVLSNGLKGVL